MVAEEKDARGVEEDSWRATHEDLPACAGILLASTPTLQAIS